MAETERDITMLRTLIGEQAAQLRSLSDLGHYLVQAHFAVRDRHSQLCEQHGILVNALSRKGVLSREELLAQAERQRPAKLLRELCTDPHIAGTLIPVLGVHGAQSLCAASHGFAGGLGVALHRFEEATDYFLRAVADVAQISADALEKGRGGAGEESAGSPGTPRSNGFLVLLQEVWQYNMLAESISCAMGLSVLQQFRAVSRAGRECMRSVSSRIGEGGLLLGGGIAAGKGVSELPHSGGGRSREDDSSRKRSSLQPQVQGRAAEAEDEEEEEDEEEVSEPEDAVDQALDLLQHIWQDTAFAESLKTCMGDAGVKSFRMISRAGRECMRFAAGRQKNGKKEEEQRPQRARPRGSLAEAAHTSSDDESRRQRREAESQILTHAPDNFLLFCRSQAQERGGNPGNKLVRLCNLKNRPDLNGCVGKMCSSIMTGSQRQNRVTVVLPSGETIRVSPSKCQFIKSDDLGGKKPHRRRRRELKWAPPPMPPDVPVEMRAFSWRMPAREVVESLGMPWAAQFSMASASIKDTVAATGRIYICGGVDQSKVLNSTECFDLQNQRWVEPRPPGLHQPRGGAASCVSGGYFWISCGSNDGSGWLGTLERLDPWTGEWKVMPSMKTARIYASMCSVDGRLYVCGGHTHNNTPIATVERFDPVIRVWKEISSMLERRTVPMAQVADSQMYLYGGVDHDYLSSLERYDPTTEFWQRLPPMAHCRSYAGSAQARGCLYVCGGSGHIRGIRGVQPSKLQSAERYNIDRTRWEELPHMRCQRAHNTTVVRDDLLFTCGGCATGKPSVEALDLRALDAWAAVGPPLMQEWTFGVVTAVAEHIYVLGGRSRKPERQARQGSGMSLLNSMVRYSMNSHVWEELPPMQNARTLAVGFHTCI